MMDSSTPPTPTQTHAASEDEADDTLVAPPPPYTEAPPTPPPRPAVTSSLSTSPSLRPLRDETLAVARSFSICVGEMVTTLEVRADYGDATLRDVTEELRTAARLLGLDLVQAGAPPAPPAQRPRWYRRLGSISGSTTGLLAGTAVACVNAAIFGFTPAVFTGFVLLNLGYVTVVAAREAL